MQQSWGGERRGRRVEGRVVSVRSDIRMQWRWPWGVLVVVLVVGGLAVQVASQVRAVVVWGMDVVSTLLGYLLVVLVVGAALGRGRWVWRAVMVVMRACLFLPVGVLRQIRVPRLRRERRVRQLVVVEWVDGQVVACLPSPVSGFHVRQGDVVRVWGWWWRGRLNVVEPQDSVEHQNGSRVVTQASHSLPVLPIAALDRETL